MREVTCKDCQREIQALTRKLEAAKTGGERKKYADQLAKRKEASFQYNEHWAAGQLDRGGSRTDRCQDHRKKHRTNIQGIAVAYVDLQTIGEVENRDNPGGPFGGLGPLPDKHQIVPSTTADLGKFEFGMNDQDILNILDLLKGDIRVLILKAGTGTGKSTFAPYRLMDPPSLEDLDRMGIPHPEGGVFRLTDLGPIIVTEPRVAAATGVATFVGEKMSGSGGVGPGFPVGYQVAGDRNHDDACQLVYVTDGTMINWLREGRLSRIGTVIVDEAHERSVNIDFIMAYLKREIEKYPHLRVIVTSATFNAEFYKEYFGGDGKAEVYTVDPVKTIGYGMPLFPSLDSCGADEEELRSGQVTWREEWELQTGDPDEKGFVHRHWKTRLAPPLKEQEVHPDRKHQSKWKDYEEDLHDTTAKLLPLRFKGFVEIDDWKSKMPEVLADYVIELVQGLDKAEIFGDVLGFLPTGRKIEEACQKIEEALGSAADVYALLSSIPADRKKQALDARRVGDKRKVVISTNLAETSLTVEGVRFVVDSGLIAQSEWDPELADGGIPTKPHSQSGIKQRWGRVGRKSPGWVFPLYNKQQFAKLDEDTPPGTTRENLESFVMTARLGGIDDVMGFEWPASFEPTNPLAQLDDAAKEAQKTFRSELARADAAVKLGGAVDDAGHPTSFGKELARFSGLGSTASALAIMYADRLACVPEVATIIALLEDTRLVDRGGLFTTEFDWPDEWRVEAAERHRGLASLAEDDAHLALLVMAAWENEDTTPPWEPSEARQAWARQWWVSDAVLLAAAKSRQDVLASLSPAMKEEVKRFVEPALLNRARGVIARTMGAMEFARDGDLYRRLELPAAATQADAAAEPSPGYAVEPQTLVPMTADRVIALRRREAKDERLISNFVLVPKALSRPSAGSGAATGNIEAMQMVQAFSQTDMKPDSTRDDARSLVQSWPIGQRFKAYFGHTGTLQITGVDEVIPPFSRPLNDEEIAASGGQEKRRKSKRRRISDEETSATRNDSEGELRLDKRPGATDEEEQARRDFTRADVQAEVEPACGACSKCLAGQEAKCEARGTCGGCTACLDGRPANCSHVDRDEPSVEDVLASWVARAKAGVDVSQPRVVVVEGDLEPESGAWVVVDEAQVEQGAFYEVVGYLNDPGQRAGLRLRRDWRPLGHDGDPAFHQDISPGDLLTVVVGGAVRDHSDQLRVLRRKDGAGRFLLREASPGEKTQEVRREIAISLARSYRGLLTSIATGTELQVTAVPARADGCFTVTLLELLEEHLKSAAVQHLVAPGGGDKEQRHRYYPAVVTAEANPSGYVQIQLLHQDVTKKVIHGFEFKRVAPKPTDDGPEQGATTGPPEPSSSTSAGCLVRLTRNPAKLDVARVDMTALLAVVEQAARQVELTGLPDSEDEILEDDPDENVGLEEADEDELDERQTVARPAPLGARLRCTRDRPLDRTIASALAELDDSPLWQNRVWTFWARSHHFKVHEGAVLPSSDVAAQDHPLRPLTIKTETPLATRQKAWDAYLKKHPLGSRVTGTALSIIDTGVFLELTSDIEVFLGIGELAWGWTGHPNDVVKVGKEYEVVLVADAEGGRLPAVSLRLATPDPFEGYKARHAIGDKVSAEVERVSKTHVNVRHSNGAPGVIHVSNLRWERVEDANDLYKTGDTVKAKIIKFDDEKRQLELNIKALLPDPWTSFQTKYPAGSTVNGRVRKLSPSRAFVDLSGGVGGSIFIRNVTGYKLESFSGHLQEGESYDFRVVGYDLERKQVDLARFGLAAPTTSSRPPSTTVTPPRQAAPVSRPTTPPPAKPAPKSLRSTTAEAASVEEATSAACKTLGLPAARVQVEILDPGARGLFGKVKRMAKVRVTERA